MAKQTALYITKLVKNAAVVVADTDTTTAKTLYTAGADDAVVKAINVSSTDTAAKVLNLILNDGTADFTIGAVSIPASSGTSGAIACVDLLNGTIFPGLPYDQNGKRILPLQAGYVLKVAAQATLTAAKAIHVVAVVEEY